MDFEKLLAQWSNEQGFTTWADDHAAVLRNLVRWLDKNAAQQCVQRTATLEPVCTCKVTVDSYNNCDAHGARRR